jgi:hypothetical protein
MAVLLINKNDFSDFKTISKGVDVERIETFIQEAQDFDLKEIICRPFFFDILKNFQEVDYQKLIHGETYIDKDGNEIEYKGIKAVLVYFAYARYVFKGSVTDTGFGVVQKKNEYSDPISEKEKKDIRTSSRQDAMIYWKECEIYLNEKIELFPKWKECIDGCGCDGVKINGRRKLKIDSIG